MRVVVLGALALRIGSSPSEVAPLSTLSLLISFDVQLSAADQQDPYSEEVQPERGRRRRLPPKLVIWTTTGSSCLCKMVSSGWLGVEAARRQRLQFRFVEVVSVSHPPSS